MSRKVEAAKAVETFSKGPPPKGMSGKYSLGAIAKSVVTVIIYDGGLFNSDGKLRKAFLLYWIERRFSTGFFLPKNGGL